MAGLMGPPIEAMMPAAGGLLAGLTGVLNPIAGIAGLVGGVGSMFGGGTEMSSAAAYSGGGSFTTSGFDREDYKNEIVLLIVIAVLLWFVARK